MIIEQVQLADIEDAAYVPPGSDIVDVAQPRSACIGPR